MKYSIIGYFKNWKSYYTAIWERIKDWKDAKRAIAIRFERYEKAIYHRGHLVMWETRYRAIATFETIDGRIISRQCSAAGWPLYAIVQVSEWCFEVEAIAGSASTKEDKKYYTSNSDCTCPAHRHRSGLIGGKCKHQLMLAQEFAKIFSITARPQPKAEEIEKPEPAKIDLAPIGDGYSPFPGCWLKAESGDSGWDLKIMGNVTNWANGEKSTVCFGKIHPQGGNRFTYSNKRFYSRGNPLQTAENVARACRELKANSTYKNCSFWIEKEKPKAEEEEVNLSDLASASLNFGNVKIPAHRNYNYRVVQSNNGLWAFYNTDTNSFADQAVYYEEINTRAQRLHQQGHTVEILSNKGHFRWTGSGWCPIKQLARI